MKSWEDVDAMIENINCIDEESARRISRSLERFCLDYLIQTLKFISHERVNKRQLRIVLQDLEKMRKKLG